MSWKINCDDNETWKEKKRMKKLLIVALLLSGLLSGCGNSGDSGFTTTDNTDVWENETGDMETDLDTESKTEVLDEMPDKELEETEAEDLDETLDTEPLVKYELENVCNGT